MVQPLAWIRVSHLWRGNARHLRAYGDPAALRHDRAASRPICAGALWARFEGHDGGRDSPGAGLAGAAFALTSGALSLGSLSGELPEPDPAPQSACPDS